MGLISNYFKVMKLTEEMEKKSDVKGDLARMQAGMNGANQTLATMAAQRQSAEQSLAAGPIDGEVGRVDAAATITQFAPTGVMISGRTVIELQLLVSLPGGIPLPVAHSAALDMGQIPRLVPGARIAVTLNPADPASLRIDWSKPAPV
ncbi:hypothetical protein TZ00_04855 [Agreia bicolorata]|uniref:Uncharacterized protein n=1 Tax=Agreia bicolorata TaxID=110935 RepID=A0ABR5CH55_9MICO|nr:hypothetical protein TZ00_04855 [Agreia bicolorata]